MKLPPNIRFVPSLPASAESAAAAVRDSSSASTLSAWLRSRRPFRNARSVNSPGRAGRAPCTQRDRWVARARSDLQRPPCRAVRPAAARQPHSTLSTLSTLSTHAQRDRGGACACSPPRCTPAALASRTRRRRACGSPPRPRTCTTGGTPCTGAAPVCVCGGGGRHAQDQNLGFLGFRG
jgi:hypothetical protein